MTPVHAYSHVNSFSSAAMAYVVSGDERYRRICENAYDFILETQCYATGGYGPDERLMPPDGSLGRSLDCFCYHAEIPCGAWAGFKLARYLMSFAGEARFGDWIETPLLNAMEAALPTQPDGNTYYYGKYGIAAGRKQFYWDEWPCCSGTYLQNVAEYHNLVFRGRREALRHTLCSSRAALEPRGRGDHGEARDGLSRSEQFGLRPDYPMAAPGYSGERSEMARRVGLGHRVTASARSRKLRSGG